MVREYCLSVQRPFSNMVNNVCVCWINMDQVLQCTQDLNYVKNSSNWMIPFSMLHHYPNQERVSHTTHKPLSPLKSILSLFSFLWSLVKRISIYFWNLPFLHFTTMMLL
uniref:Uncharacterized protein n=1 Tax=Octopus bimaculoides TaxID=37653 RepID=A0A0L8HEF1_OCTBM